MAPANKERRTRADKDTVADLVRLRDREQYWSALFAPASKRAGLLALYAFAAELRHIPVVVSEPMVGQIRLQWWRDAIELSTPDGKTGNPVADALAVAIAEHNLPKEDALRLVDARLADINGDAPADIPALKAGLWETSGTVFSLATAILGPDPARAMKAARHAAVAYGLTQLLITFPLQASRGKLMLPPAYFESRGVSLGAIYRGKSSASLKAALTDLIGAVNRSLRLFRAEAETLDKVFWPAFLPLAGVKAYLRVMADQDFKPFQMVPAVNPVRQFWRIWRAARRQSL